MKSKHETQNITNAFKETNASSRSAKDAIEQRRVDLGGLPSINRVDEEAFLHVYDVKKDDKDNKIAFDNFQKSIRNIENAKIKGGEISGATVPIPQANGHITNKEYVDNALITKAPIQKPEFTELISAKSADNNLISYFSSNANGTNPYFQIHCYNAKSNTIVVPVVVRYINNVFTTTDIANANLTGANPTITNPPPTGDNSNKIATTSFCQRLKASRGSEFTFGLNQTINITQYGFVYVAINNGNNSAGSFSVYINGVANTITLNGFANQSFSAPIYAGDTVSVGVGDGSLSLTLGKIFYTNLSF